MIERGRPYGLANSDRRHIEARAAISPRPGRGPLGGHVRRLSGGYEAVVGVDLLDSVMSTSSMPNTEGGPCVCRLSLKHGPPSARAREEFYLCQIPFGMDGPSLARHVPAMEQTDRLTCPKCGAKLIAKPSPSASGLRTPHCPDCDCLDPLKSERAMGWLKSELQPPKR